MNDFKKGDMYWSIDVFLEAGEVHKVCDTGYGIMHDCDQDRKRRSTGKTKEELSESLKDAIFTAFEIPPRYCNPNIINIDGFLASAAEEKKTVYATT